MAIRRAKANQQMEGPSLLKAATGIHGLDEITDGGLPGAGRRWCAERRAAERRCWPPNSSCAARFASKSPACS